MHFWLSTARWYGRVPVPRKTSLNWFMPAFVNRSVGSSSGTTPLDRTAVWPRPGRRGRRGRGSPPVQLVPAHGVAANAEGHGFAEEDLFQPRHSRLGRQDTEQDAGPILLHEDRGAEDVQRSCRQQEIVAVAN